MTLEEKLAAFDAEVNLAFNSYTAQLGARRTEIIALARARHVSGHAQHGDGYLFELSETELAAERDQEYADGLVYEMVRRRKALAALP